MLATFLPLFVGWPRRTLVRRVLFGLLLACFAALCWFAVAAASTTTTAFDRLEGRPELLAGAAAAALVFMAALTWLAYRYPTVTLIAVLALLPLRLPLPLGDGNSNLLVPLYLLTLAMALAEIVCRDRLALSPGFRRDPTRIALACMIAILGVSSLWVGVAYAPRIKAFSLSLVKLFAFVVPFATLYYLVEGYLTSRLRLRRLIWAILASGVVLALIGIVQAPTRWVIVNRAGVLDNELMQHTFRANSLFWDPNMFGRFCALIVLLGVAMFLAVLAAIALGLTYSRSGLLSVLAGLIVVELAWLGWKKGLIAVFATLLVLAGGLAGITAARDTRDLGKKIETTMGLNKLTGGRVYLVKAGWRMYKRHPVRGVGLAGFPQAFPSYRTSHAAKLTLKESHTTPVTIAAEQGTLGLVAFGGLLVTFFATTLRKRRYGASRDLYLMQAGIVGGVVALCVSSLSYNAFFEDPYVWVFLAMGSAVATRLVAPAQAEREGESSGPGMSDEPATD